MVSQLAEELYDKSLSLEKYSTFDLMLKRKRVVLLNELQTVQQLICSILNELKTDLSYSSEYYELALFMCRNLFECVCFLASKTKNCRQTVWRYIHGFHNLPRAFLPLENKARLSVAEAMDYYKPYLKLD
ncbi:MAG: hypothetical protein J5563_01095 [Clostridia bacterium]|nr:hypothetical protein [Clostridia bacterium]